MRQEDRVTLREWLCTAVVRAGFHPHGQKDGHSTEPIAKNPRSHSAEVSGTNLQRSARLQKTPSLFGGVKFWMRRRVPFSGLAFLVSSIIALGCGGAAAQQSPPCAKESLQSAMRLHRQMKPKASFQLAMRLVLEKPDSFRRFNSLGESKCRRLGLFLMGLSGQPGGLELYEREIRRIAKQPAVAMHYVAPALYGLGLWIRFSDDEVGKKRAVEFMKSIAIVDWWASQRPGTKEPSKVPVPILERVYVGMGYSRSPQLEKYLLKARDTPSIDNTASGKRTARFRRSLAELGLRAWSIDPLRSQK